MLERTVFLTSLLWMQCLSWSDGKNHAKKRTIKENYQQYVNISCFTIIVLQGNSTVFEMLNYLCTEP